MDLTSKLKKAAAGVMSAAMLTSSVPFAASQTVAAEENNYADALALSLYFFDANACGEGVEGGPLTWRSDCHLQDKNVRVDSSISSLIGENYVDVSGGFHDAGDHIKFNLTIGFAMSTLGMAEYLNPGAFEAANCKDHLIYEMKKGADYLMKTTFLDAGGEVAAVAHVVADGELDHDYWGAPEMQNDARPVYWITADNNNSGSCAEMAAGLAAAAYIIKDSDPDYAAECLRYAEALYRFGKNNYGVNPAGLQRPGFDDQYYYNAKYGVDYHDELALAQTWLYIHNIESMPTAYPNGDKSYSMDGNTYYDYYIYSWDKVWQGYSAMMYKLTGDKAFWDEFAREYDSENGNFQDGVYNANGWGATRYNCGMQMNAYILADGNMNSPYAKGAKYQMDYILGNNDINGGMSFLVGYNENHPENLHHRGANPNRTGVEFLPYGMLVGGPTTSGFIDDVEQYQSTEGALDYNGCFALAAAGLVNLYSQTGSADKYIADAPEVNTKFTFSDIKMEFTADMFDVAYRTNYTCDPGEKPFELILGDAIRDEALNYTVYLENRDGKKYELPLEHELDPGEYTVKVDIDATDKYAAAEGLTSENWEKLVVTEHADEKGSGKCAKCGKVMDGFGAQLIGYSLDLDGEIRVNFYMDYTETGLKNDPTMHFELPNGKVMEYTLKDAGRREVNGKEYYVYPCSVSAKEMTDDIVAYSMYNGHEGEIFRFTVKDYADYIIKHENEFGTPAAELAKAMLDYGGCVQEYFGYNTENLAYDSVPDLSRVLIDDKSEINMSSIKGLKYMGTSLMLTDKIAARHYFKLNEGVSINDFKFDCIGGARPTEKDGAYYIEVDPNAVKNLDRQYTLTIDGEAALTYCINDYLAKVINGEYDEAFKNVAKSLYLYGRAAKVYENGGN